VPSLGGSTAASIIASSWAFRNEPVRFSRTGL